MGGKDILEEGKALYAGKNYAGALSYFLSLPADSDIDPVDIAYYLGLCYSKLKRYEDAMLYLEQVVTSGDGQSDAKNAERVQQCRYILAVIYCQSGRKQLADYELNNLLQSGYKPASVYSSFAYMSWENGDVPKCLEYYEKALSIDENNPTALNGLGYVLASEEKDLPRALTLCKKALSLAPESAACLDSIGWVYYKMGLYAQARKYLEQAKNIDGENEVILRHLQDAELVDE